MMPKTDLVGAPPAASGGGATTFNQEYSTSLENDGDDFFAVMSQALSRPPDKPPLPQSSDPSSSYASDYDAASNSDDSSDDDSTTSTNASKPATRPSSTASLNRPDSNDASVLSNIMALLAQPAIAPADPKKLAPPSGMGKETKEASGPGGSEATKLDQQGGSTAAQKLADAANKTQANPLAAELMGPNGKPLNPAALKALADAAKNHPPNPAPPTGRNRPRLMLPNHLFPPPN